MKKLFLVIRFLSVLSFSHGQSPLPVGKNQLNFGVGLSEWGIPVYIGLDHSVHRNITVGGEVSFRSYYERYRGYRYRHNIVGISANGNYHFNTVLKIPRQWDFYAGLNLGFYSWSSPPDYYGRHSSGLGLGAQIGGRYYFSPKTGINLEFGGGNEFVDGKIGLSIKL
jgi:hypothetical protein